MTMLSKTEQEGKVPPRQKFTPVDPLTVFKVMQVGIPGGVQCMVTLGPGGDPNDHTWSGQGVEFAPWIAEKSAGRKPAYFTLGAYAANAVSRWRGRTRVNVLGIRCLTIDVDCGADKWAKALASGRTDGVYETEHEARSAVLSFTKTTGVRPTFIVESGSGGLHLYYVFDSPLTPDVWQGRANALVALAKSHGFKIDAQCTTDAARFMRAAGSIHQGTGKVVQAYGCGDPLFTLGQIDAFVKYDPAIHDSPQRHSTSTVRQLTGINADIAREYTPYSYKQAAQFCGAMRNAAQNNGRDTTHAVWILALRSAALSTEGEAFAHEISCGHAGYCEAKTDKKLNSLTGGPASCAAWANAYGAGGPCESCEFGEV